MPITEYEYDKEEVNVNRLTQEIQDSAIVIALDHIDHMGDDLGIYFKDTLSSGDELILDGIVDDHTGEPLESDEVQHVVVDDFVKTSDNKIKIAAYEAEGTSATIVTHDFTDKCSWYWGSSTSTNEVLTTSNDLMFSSAHTHWIDLTHGRLYDEDTVNASNTYTPVIKVNDVVVTTGFTIDYVAGTVTFNSSQAGNTVKASYKYANTSYYILRPESGKKLTIKAAEVQFSSDVSFASPFIFEAWVNHPTHGYIAIPGTRIAYKNAKDFMSAANEGQGLIPAWGGMANDVHVFPFNYARPKSVLSSLGTEIRVYINDHAEVSGEFATSTFYVIIEDE